MFCNPWSELNFFLPQGGLKGRTLSFKTLIIGDGAVNLISKIISENNGIREVAFETMQLKRPKWFAQYYGKVRWHIKRVKMVPEILQWWFELSDRDRPDQPKKFEDEELEQRLEENPTRITHQEISHRLHRLGRIQKAGRRLKAPN